MSAAAGRVVLGLCLVLLGQAAAAGDGGDHAFLYGFLAGTYRVVGQEIDSDATYGGTVVFEGRQDHLAVTREIRGETTRGTGRIEHALGPDAVAVLRVRFTRGGQAFEITYLVHGDLDNYARLSGFVYRPGAPTARPGLEALFVVPGGP